ncbi:APC family permease [Burkholderia sp. L27(2015)]|uniref:APC family permease n=1 Tax=Burkholderia sp. L27(2015) TaxID=1641858 RepID=UPI00131D8A36|nr:APC family permease [Burkholderia sp. L27(2015)]
MDNESIRIGQELKRGLTFSDLVIYGAVFMIPIAPFAIYGYVSAASGGMVALAYLIGLVAMFFTALSYKFLSQDFPVSGSAYAYARRGIGLRTGFLTGWMLILDYLLIPALTYIVAAAALYQLFPVIPRWVWIVLFLVGGTVPNLVGITTTAKVNKIFMVLQLVVLAIFIAAGLHRIYSGPGIGHLTLRPLFQANMMKPELLFSAVSVCALSFLGFDAISTLAEEVKGNDNRTVGNATIASLLLIGILFIAQTWIAGDLAAGMTFKSLDTAFYEIAEIAGGRPLALLTAIAAAITFGLSCSIVSQAAIARLLYAMARDGQMPKVLSSVHSKYKTPYVSVLVVAAVSFFLSIGFMEHLDTLTNFVNFGALSSFLILHVTVVVHFIFKRGSKSFIKHLICPIFGFLIIAYVLWSMGSATWELGLSWLFAGIVYYLVLTRVLRRDLQLEL